MRLKRHLIHILWFTILLTMWLKIRQNFLHCDRKCGNNSVKKYKTILYATKVYGMDHWGIGFGHEPFQNQGMFYHIF